MSALPQPYVSATVGRARIAALPDALERVRDAVEDADTFYAFADARPDALRVEGRGPAIVIDGLAGERWLVRHYRRGGAVARLLADRYLRLREPRPFRELRASVEARRRGVRTPEIVAAIVYPSGLHTRGDVVLRYLPDSLDLAAAVFGDLLDRPGRMAAAAAAGQLVREAHERGVVHADLNLKNLLIEVHHGEPRAWLLDLDRCRMVANVGPRRRAAMLRRVTRSFDRHEAHTARAADDARKAFFAGYGAPAAPADSPTS